jgi:Transposase and inactivated derivatives
MKRRKFFKDILTHCYQRSADDGVLFYSYSDHLAHFTLFCTLARKHGIQVLSLCQMPDHVHDSVRAKSKAGLGNFKREVNTFFSRQWNGRCRTKGHVLRGRYGWAQKFGDKKGRTNLVYVGNNPVERRLVGKAEEYRWNFLAYASSDHPFSEKLVFRDARWPLQKAVKEVKAQFKVGKPLNYAQLDRLFKPLTRQEGLQLTDFIITTYNCIDYEAAIRFFDTGEDMITSMHATTGSEYDINEVFTLPTDR